MGEDFQVQVPEKEWFQHSRWFRAEQIAEQMRRRDAIINVVLATVTILMTIATFVAFGGY